MVIFVIVMASHMHLVISVITTGFAIMLYRDPDVILKGEK